MKHPAIFAIAAFCTTGAFAHDHLGAGALDVNKNGIPDQGEPLALVAGNLSGTKRLLPKPIGSRYGGYFSLDEQPRAEFPNDYFSFVALSDGQVLDAEPGHAKTGSYLWVMVTAVSGPAGGHIGFWDENWSFSHTTPTVSFATNLPTNNYKFVLSEPLSSPPGSDEDPYGHIHNRGWTADIPGDYTVSLQFVDLSTNGTGGGPIHAPSQIYTIQFSAIPEPGTAVLLLLGTAGVLGTRRRRAGAGSTGGASVLTLTTLGLMTLASSSAFAHLTYPGTRDFGVFSEVEPRSFTISSQSTKTFGWADGTDADFARQDDQRYFRLTLIDSLTITISVTAADAAQFLPAFSIYSGLGHAAADSTNPDYDSAAVTQTYLATLGDPQPRKGAFDALHSFKIGNDSKPETGYLANLVTFTYIGNAADGSARNFGTAAGINGDGLADGLVSASFTLGPGDYTLVIGGADLFSSDTSARGFTATVSSIPEPGPLPLLGAATVLVACGRVRWKGNERYNLNPMN